MNHKHVSSKQAVGIWLFLVVASISVAWLGDHHGIFGAWTVVAVVLVAAIKARAIILYYMDVKFAPLQLRLPFELWLLACTGIILGFWYIS
ncbi:Prokaryotic Cytochrome C oxidase subunit IV [Spongiibacter sp. IMCC21906]|jgi:hypothetical protein|uniref:cytochrome C oxidase subunit IV family protein n=1 Tax=Spongiibacter sp. IMCC21906 TaxID=1620392 RepID=UPI00062DD2D8|nr:cytochrome C oxidase subunit IV family protein [Spongiibacter sp. IMCC21906]AKH68721.1 Prokaryotic Cytochrome C oxidase subunit IV [Spongiibacter sp. IMCC21906]